MEIGHPHRAKNGRKIRHAPLRSTIRPPPYTLSFAFIPLCFLTVPPVLLYRPRIMSRILPPSRPRRDKDRIAQILNFFKDSDTLLTIVFVRGYYLDSMGAAGRDDRNIYDDACFVATSDFTVFESYNANTNPSFIRRGGRNLAQLDLGVYRFYRGMHKRRYAALRAFPEGREMPVTRDGKPSTAQYINIHKGSTSETVKDVVWSEGCLTLPDTQYGDFVMRVWTAMDRLKLETVRVILLENKATPSGQKLFDGKGRIVA